MEPRPCLFVCLEEALLPIDVLQFQISVLRRNINEFALVFENDALDTFGVPKQLIAVIIPDDVVVVALSSHIDSIRYLIPLVPAIIVERSDDIVEESSFLNRFHHILACRRVEKVVGTLENEGEAFGHETNLVGFSPA
jgi:hypothetical protein